MNPTEAKQEAARQIAVQQASHVGKPIEFRFKTDPAEMWRPVLHNESLEWVWNICDYRIAADPDKPQWPDCAPPWAQWMARDRNGRWAFFETRPRISDDKEWLNGGRSVYLEPRQVPISTTLWQDSIIQRPQKPEPKQARETVHEWWTREGYQIWMRAGNGPKELAISAWDASAARADSRKALSESVRIRAELAEKLTRGEQELQQQLSDAQAEGERWKHNAEAINDSLDKSQAEVKRLEEELRCKFRQTDVDMAHACEVIQEQATELNGLEKTVERLRVALEGLRAKMQNIPHHDGTNPAICPRCITVDAIDAALASITAPTDSVPTGLVEMCRDALSACHPANIWDKARMYYTSEKQMTREGVIGIWHTDRCRQADAAITLCERHLSGEKPEQTDLEAISKGEK